MRLVVTGGAGYIGSVVTAALVQRGDEVVVVDDLSKRHADAVDPRSTWGRFGAGRRRLINDVAPETAAAALRAALG